MRPRERLGIEEFVDRFFGEGNDAGQYPAIVDSCRETLSAGPDGPIALPRHIEWRDWFAMYVISGNGTNTTQVRELIQAFVGPTYCTKGDTVPAVLDPADPVDSAVIEFAGPGSTFIVGAGTNKERRRRMRQALELMQRVAVTGPPRNWYIPKPLGRLLAEFQAALATGGQAVSEAALNEIEARGGITATNLAHLRIKRLDRLGRGKDLLAMEGLSNVLRQDPPLPVKQAVLNAIYSVHLCELLESGEFEAALDSLRGAALPAPLPLHEDVRDYGDEAATVLVTTAVGREDIPSMEEMVSALADTGYLKVLPEVVLRRVEELIGRPAPPPEVSEKNRPHQSSTSDSEPSSSASPESWLDLLPLAAQRETRALDIVRDEEWHNWPSPAESDEDISRFLDALDDSSWKNAWEIASGPFIEAVGYEYSAPHTALSFLTYALSFHRLGPGDLLAIQALTEIFLRSSPSPGDYRDILELVQSSCEQWVSPENAIVALDFADRLVLSACPDRAVRANLALALLGPLHRLQGRLEPSIIEFAHQLSGELEIPFEWHLPERLQEEDPLAGLPPLSLLLYSLDEAVLQRTEAKLRTLVPELKIALSHDKVGSDSLRHKSRNADLVVLATRCAKHAATGFITESAKKAHMTYADGSGSASLLRAAVDGLSHLAQDNQHV